MTLGNCVSASMSGSHELGRRPLLVLLRLVQVILRIGVTDAHIASAPSHSWDLFQIPTDRQQ